MGDRYREEIGRLREALNDVSRREEAAEIVRGLIDAIILRPSGTGRGRTLSIDLSGGKYALDIEAGMRYL